MSEPLEYAPKKILTRFLFSDGKTVDVLSESDSSTMRGWVLDQMKMRLDVTDKDLRIAGSCLLDGFDEDDDD